MAGVQFLRVVTGIVINDVFASHSSTLFPVPFPLLPSFGLHLWLFLTPDTLGRLPRAAKPSLTYPGSASLTNSQL